MLTGSDSAASHACQNVALLLLSVFFLPLDTLVLCASWVLQPLIGHHVRVKSSTAPRTVLVTGVGMTKGLALARLFARAGHKVIGVDFEADGALVCGRVSRSLARFYSLDKPAGKDGVQNYVSDLLRIVLAEEVDIWVSCSGVASAVEDGLAKELIERETPCRAVQFDVRQTETLHEKDSFIEYTKQLGLHVPETTTVTDRKAAEEILEKANGKEYIMKSIGLDDSTRGDMTLLPRPSTSETGKHLARMNISKANPWIVQQFIRGREYCTHSLIICGEVKAFVACPSAELLMHYEALPRSAPLSKAMFSFTKTFADKSGRDFTGHLSFDFLVDDWEQRDPRKIVLYPIECNPRAHTAVALFDNTPSLVDSYLCLVTPEAEPGRDCVVPEQPAKYYWVGHDLVNEIIMPLLALVQSGGSWRQVANGLGTFSHRFVFWKDGTYQMWDPLPWWWLYHVYWPMSFLVALIRGRRWSRVNVSTTKMFLC